MSPTLPTADAEDEYEEPYIDPPSPSQAGQPGNLHSHYQRVLMSKRNIANPSPLGLSGFAFTTLLLSAINLGTLGVTHANIVVVSAFAYGGLVQLLARMWPGNIHWRVEIVEYYDSLEFQYAFALFLFGWFIFTSILLVYTLSSSAAHFSVFLTLNIAFLCLALGRRYPHLVGISYQPYQSLTYAGGVFGMLSAFAAWYNALAGIAASNHTFFARPVLHFPWSEHSRKLRQKSQTMETSQA